MEIESRISQLEYTVQKKCLRLCRKVSGSNFYRFLGIRADVFETYRTKKRQYELVKSGKSWTRESNHLIRTAFDLVLAKKIHGVVINYIWTKFFNGKDVYSELCRLGEENGLRSLGRLYGRDYFHFELPQIFQGKSILCYAFSIINLLQKHDIRYRRMKPDECMYMAKKIEQERGKTRVDKNGAEYELPKSVLGSLEAAKELGYIEGFEKVKIKDWHGVDYPVLISQRNRYIGGNTAQRAAKKEKYLEVGEGIYGHVAVFDFFENKQLYVVSSSRSCPVYRISKLDAISATYKIKL